MKTAHSIGVLVSGILSIVAVSPTDGQVVVPEAERFIRLGTRMQPLRPGEGGQLNVTAPEAFCADPTHLMEVRFFPVPGTEQPVVRLPAGPSLCRWEFEGMPAGYYDAFIQAENDRPILAQARGRIWPGVTTLLVLESSQVEVEGRLSGDLSVVGGVRLKFEVNGGMGGHSKWTTPLKADGSYRIKLTGVERDDQICISAEPSGLNALEPAEPIGAVLLKCAQFLQGLQRLDIDDVRLPPGVVRIEMPPVDGAASYASGILTVGIVGQSGSQMVQGFNLSRGLRVEYFSDYRERELTITSLDRKTLLASSRVTMSVEQPVRLVTLGTPPR